MNLFGRIKPYTRRTYTRRVCRCLILHFFYRSLCHVRRILTEYNMMTKQRMDLVLFLPFLEHIARTVRVLKLPLGNTLAVGIGGSGRRSVTLLASYVGWFLSQGHVKRNCGMVMQMADYYHRYHNRVYVLGDFRMFSPCSHQFRPMCTNTVSQRST